MTCHTGLQLSEKDIGGGIATGDERTQTADNRCKERIQAACCRGKGSSYH